MRYICESILEKSILENQKTNISIPSVVAHLHVLRLYVTLRKITIENSNHIFLCSRISF